MGSRIGHSGIWPPYRRQAKRLHTFAWDDGERLIVQDSGQVFSPATYTEWRRIVLDLHLDVFVRSIWKWRFRDAAVRQASLPKCADQVNAVWNSLDRNARITSFTFRQGNAWASLREFGVWGNHTQPSMGLLDELQATCEYQDVGIHPSPASLGREGLMRHTGTQRWTAPNNACLADLRDGLVGGRADLFDGTRHRFAWEYDECSCHPSICQEPIPIGTALRLTSSSTPPWEWNEQPFTYYVRCAIVIPEDPDGARRQKIGLFPTRDPKTKRVTYPSTPGIYQDVWLFRHDVRLCLARGYTVLYQGEGWAWQRGEAVLKDWADWTLKQRESAPPAIALLIKAAAVAGLGLFMTGDVEYRVIDQVERIEDIITIIIDENMHKVGEVIAVQPKVPSSMLHWGSWILSVARLRLVRRMLDEAADNNYILSSNFDSITLARPSRLPVGNKPGEWRLEVVHTDPHQPYPRAIISQERQRLPGITGAKREVIIKEHSHDRRNGATPGLAPSRPKASHPHDDPFDPEEDASAM